MNERYIESVEMHPDGYKITKYKYIEPNDTTFTSAVGSKYSIANRGVQRSNIHGTATVDHIGDESAK